MPSVSCFILQEHYLAHYRRTQHLYEKCITVQLIGKILQGLYDFSEYQTLGFYLLCLMSYKPKQTGCFSSI